MIRDTDITPLENDLYLVSKLRYYLIEQRAELGTIIHDISNYCSSSKYVKTCRRYQGLYKFFSREIYVVNEIINTLGRKICPRFYDWVIKVFDPNFSSVIFTFIGLANPKKFPRVSKYWKYLGLSLINGVPQTIYTFSKYPYNKKAKSILYVITTDLINRKHQYYYPHYVDFRYKVRRYKDEDHRNARARRLLMKVISDHIWRMYRCLNGCTISLPYAQGVLGHGNFIEPPYFKLFCESDNDRKFGNHY